MDLGSMYRDIVESSPDGIWVFDLDGNTLYANAQVAVMLGRDPGEAPDLSVYDPLDETGRAQFAQHLADLRAGILNPGEVECQWVREDGSLLWVLVRESPLLNPDGTVRGILHRISDYSERHRLFGELSSGRQQLAEAQRIAKIGSWEWDVRADTITASDELYALYGLTPEQFSGRYADFLGMVHEDDRPVVDGVVQDALAGKDTFEFDARMHRVDGSPVWVRGRGVTVRDEDGVPTRMTGTHQDVTEPKAAESALHDMLLQNTLMQAIASAANEAETLVDVLRTAQALVTRHDDWDRGRAYVPDPERPGELLPYYVSERDEREDGNQPALVERELRLARETLRRAASVWDEDTVPERPAVSLPVTLPGGEVVVVVVVTASAPFERHTMIQSMLDQIAVQIARVAERERGARQLEEARDAAMEGSRQKSEFLATMSHEIRTPLNGVIGLNDLLLRTDLDPHQLRLASGVQAASRSLLHVINDVLDFSKIEAGALELESVDFAVRPVFDQVAGVLAESARVKGIELVVACHPDVPARLNGDPNRLAQVVTNLGSNAVKFTDVGEVYVRASVDRVEPGRRRLRVDVSDTGVGVAPEKHETIFDVFSQEDASTTRRYGGTGLGLTISREIVHALGGEIGVDSAPGQGSTFWFTAWFGETEPELAEPATPALAGQRVLVVDDNAHNRQILAEQLSAWGTRVSTAPDADSAVASARTAAAAGDPYHLILLDMAMPGRDGLDLAREIHADRALAAATLVLLTSSGEPQANALSEVGIVDCLTKPLTATDLRETVVRVLGQHLEEGAAGGSASTGSASAGVEAADPRPSVGGRGRVLVVEDNPVNQLVACGILESLGYTVDTAEDGLEAVEMWRARSYAAVLMDVQMPRLDGYGATRAIRSAEPAGARVPVLAMTAAAVEGEREKCLAAGMDDFLTKPVDPAALAEVLARWARPAEAPPGRARPECE
ncbi:MAG TPA: response regulator [Nocardioidaceae bacterium]|nr:response regulator [Nocardioidaceae bacterium]